MLTRSAKGSSRRGRRFEIAAVLVSIVWICRFLMVYFRQPVESTDATRGDLVLLMMDELLGFGGGSETVASRSGIQFLAQRTPMCLAAIVLLAGAMVYGEAVLRLLRVSDIGDRLERLIFRMGAGLSLLSLITLACGLAGQLNRIALFSAVGSVGGLTLIHRMRSRGGPDDFSGRATAEAAVKSSFPWLRNITLLIVVPFAAYLLLGSLTPPVDFDVREYHLQGPKEWFQQGHISFLRHNVYTSFPFLSEMLLLAGMVVMGDWWSGALCGQLVLACFQLLSAGCVFAMARRWVSSEAGWLAMLIYLTTPWTLRISLIAYAEGAIAFYMTASAMLALLIRQRGSGTSGGPVLLCGVLAGSAMASKYTGLISAVIPALALLTISWQTKVSPNANEKKHLETPWFRRYLKTISCYSIGVLLAIAPWLLRNLADTGNPVYPLAWSILGGSEWSDEMNARWKPAHASKEHDPGLILTKHYQDVALYNTWTSGLLFAFAVPAVLLSGRYLFLRYLLGLLVWGFGTWWALTHRIDRFWVPLIPLLSVLCGSLWELSRTVMWKSFVTLVLLSVTAYNVFFCTLAIVGFHAGLMDLQQARELAIRSDILFLNQNLPESARVLMVGEAEVFDADFALVYNTTFDDSIFEQWTTHPDDHSLPVKERRMNDVAAIKARLSAEKITHVFVNWGEILRYRRPDSYGYAEYVQPARIQQLVDCGILRSRRTFLLRPWQEIDEQGRQVIESWDGYQRLIDGSGNFTVVEVFEVNTGQTP